MNNQPTTINANPAQKSSLDRILDNDLVGLATLFSLPLLFVGGVFALNGYIHRPHTYDSLIQSLNQTGHGILICNSETKEACFGFIKDNSFHFVDTTAREETIPASSGSAMMLFGGSYSALALAGAYDRPARQIVIYSSSHSASEISMQTAKQWQVPIDEGKVTIGRVVLVDGIRPGAQDLLSAELSVKRHIDEKLARKILDEFSMAVVR